MKLFNKIICFVIGHDIGVNDDGVVCDRCGKLIVKFKNLPKALDNLSKAMLQLGVSTKEVAKSFDKLRKTLNETQKKGKFKFDNN